jgi:hypothetical protein
MGHNSMAEITMNLLSTCLYDLRMNEQKEGKKDGRRKREKGLQLNGDKFNS